MKILVLEFITTIGGVQAVYKNILPLLSDKFCVSFLDPYKDDFAKELNNTNIEVLDIPINSTNSLGWGKGAINNLVVLMRYGFRYFIYLIKLINVVKDNEYDLLYVSGKKELIFGYFISLITNTKYIYHAHGFNSYKDIRKLQYVAMKKAERIVAVSKDVENKLLQAQIHPAKVEVVHNGLNLKLANSLTENLKCYSTKDNVFKVLMIGSIQPKKGIHTLINAINLLHEEGYNICLDIIGEIPSYIFEDYKNELLSIANKHKNLINFLGFKRNVYRYLNESDVFVLPSTEESFGMVLLEAMFLSKPVIGSNIGGIPEVINDGYNGFLFEQNNVEDLAKKIKLLCDNKELCEFMGANGKYRLQNEFTSEIQAKKIINIINGCFEQ